MVVYIKQMFCGLDSCICHRHLSMVVGTCNIQFATQAQIKNFHLIGPMISNVRDYHIDNFRFPTLEI